MAVLHLIANTDVGVLGQQQRHQVHAALLGCQVNGADALPRHGIGVSTVFQQCGANVHLVLFGSDVERRVAILRRAREAPSLENFKYEGCSFILSVLIQLRIVSLGLYPV